MKPITVYLPQNLDIDQLIKDYPPTDIKSFNKDYLAYVINLIYKSISSHNKLLEDGQLIPIHTGFLKEKIWNGDQYLKYLVSSGVFITDGKYVVGEKTRGYLLNEQFRGKTKKYLIKYSKFLKKYKEHQERNARKVRRQLPYLYKWYQTKGLTIDKDNAKLILKDKLQVKLRQRLRKGSKLTKKDIAKLSMHSWRYHINTLYKKSYQYIFSIDEQGGRLYTVLTNLSSDFRKFVNYNGQPLVHVDIANSQPYFSALLLNPIFWTTYILSSDQKERLKNQLKSIDGEAIEKMILPGQLTCINLNEKVKNLLSDIDYESVYSSIYLMFVNNDESEYRIEFQRYKKLVSEGNLYEYFIEEYAKREGKTLTRDRAKKIMFEIFFSQNSILLSPKKRLFKELFPNIFQLFKKIKSKSHNTLAILLQNIESQCFLHQACAKIATDHPEIPIFTIHDSIVTTVGNEYIVQKVMQNVLTNITGLTPTLKIEYWK